MVCGETPVAPRAFGWDARGAAQELVIFAALAAVVLFQLYAVLGRRVGRQPEDAEADAERPRFPTPGVEDDRPGAGRRQRASPPSASATRPRAAPVHHRLPHRL